MMIDKLQSIAGPNWATCDPAELYCYSFDASYIRGHADYAVRPESPEEVSRVVKLAGESGTPVIPRGSASGLTGGAVPVNGGIVLDMTRMNRILELDLENLQVVVEPGLVHKKLNDELAKHGLFFPPDPGSSDMCSIGGLISNGGSGMHSVKYGTVRDYVMSLEVVMPNGDIINTGCKAPKMSAGYDLTRLFVGSEGTLGVITKARLKVRPLPESRSMLVAYFDVIEDAGRAAVSIISSGVTPAAMEILDGSAIRAVQKVEPGLGLPDAEAMLLFELDGYAESVARQVAMVSASCEKYNGRIHVAGSHEEEEKLWTMRRLVSVVIMRLEPGKVSIYEAEDLGIPMNKVPFMLKKIREIGEKHGLTIVTFGHIGDGDLHTGIAIDLRSQAEWDKVHAAKDDLYDVVLELGGTLSAEHGIGVIRGKYMSRSYGKGYEVMKAIKRAIDPQNIMNPGKMGM